MDSQYLYAILFFQIDPNLTNNYLILGYVVMGLIALVYVISLVSRQRNVQKDIELMRQLLEEDEGK